MFDATSKYPSGLVTANVYQLGNYDQCIDVVSSDQSIKGKYCLADTEFSPKLKKYPPFYTLLSDYEFSLNYDPRKSVLEKFKVSLETLGKNFRV